MPTVPTKRQPISSITWPWWIVVVLATLAVWAIMASFAVTAWNLFN